MILSIFNPTSLIEKPPSVGNKFLLHISLLITFLVFYFNLLATPTLAASISVEKIESNPYWRCNPLIDSGPTLVANQRAILKVVVGGETNECGPPYLWVVVAGSQTITQIKEPGTHTITLDLSQPTLSPPPPGTLIKIRVYGTNDCGPAGYAETSLIVPEPTKPPLPQLGTITFKASNFDAPIGGKTYRAFSFGVLGRGGGFSVTDSVTFKIPSKYFGKEAPLLDIDLWNYKDASLHAMLREIACWSGFRSVYGAYFPGTPHQTFGSFRVSPKFLLSDGLTVLVSSFPYFDQHAFAVVIKPGSNQEQTLAEGSVLSTAKLILVSDNGTTRVLTESFSIKEKPWYNTIEQIFMDVNGRIYAFYGKPPTQNATKCNYDTQSSCERDPNCKWLGECKGQLCAGSPRACSLYSTQSDCTSAGCKWEYTYGGTKSFYCRDFGTLECQSGGDPYCETRFNCPEGLGCKIKITFYYCCADQQGRRTTNCGTVEDMAKINCPYGATVDKKILSCEFRGGTYGGEPITEPIKFDCDRCRGLEYDPFCKEIGCVRGPSCIGTPFNCSRYTTQDRCVNAGCQWNLTNCKQFTTKDACLAANCVWEGCVVKTGAPSQPPTQPPTASSNASSPQAQEEKICPLPFMKPVKVPITQDCSQLEWKPKLIRGSGVGTATDLSEFVYLMLRIRLNGPSGEGLEGRLLVDTNEYKLKNIKITETETRKSLTADVFRNEEKIGTINLELHQKQRKPEVSNTDYKIIVRSVAMGDLELKGKLYKVYILGRIYTL